jgi:hypothetical protein
MNKLSNIVRDQSLDGWPTNSSVYEQNEQQHEQGREDEQG